MTARRPIVVSGGGLIEIPFGDAFWLPTGVLTLGDTALAAQSGNVRLENASAVNWRNAANTADVVVMTYGADDNLYLYSNKLSLSAAGALTLATEGGRLVAPMGSQANHSLRFLFQNSVVNAQTSVGAIPNGTSPIAGFIAYNSADPDNAGYVRMFINGTTATLVVTHNGTGVDLPMAFNVGGSDRMTIAVDGTVTVGAFKFTGGTPGSGKVLVSDAAGVASWQTPVGSPDAGAQKLHGFINRTDSTLSYNPAIPLITLAQTGGVKYWYKGTEVTAAASVTVDHSLSTAGYYVYFADASGTLTVSTTVWDLVNHVPVAYVYYEASLGDGVLWEERHAAQRDPLYHRYLHLTQGAKKVSGFALSGYTLESGAANSAVQIAVASGVVADEDIDVTTAAIASGGPYAVWHKDALGRWTFQASATVPFKAGTYIQYDNANTLTDLVAGEFVNYWVLASTASTSPHHVIIVTGQAKYSGIGDALFEGFPDVDFTGFPVHEFAPLYRLTFGTDAAYATTGKCALVAVTSVSKEFDPTRLTTDYVDIVEETTLPTPSAGHVFLFAKRIGGRMMPAFKGPSGLFSTLQPHLARNGWAWWLPSLNSAGVSSIGAASVTMTGTATAANYATTNLHTRCRRLDLLVTVAATTAVAGYRYGVAAYRTTEGFHHVARICPATGVTGINSRRCFVGMSSSTAAPTDVNPSSLTTMVGVGYDSGDANWQIMSNDATGAATKVNTGIARPSVDRQSVYAVNIFAFPGGASIGVQFLDEETGQEFSRILTTDLPLSTTALCPRGYSSVGGTSSVVGFTFFSLYIETDN